MTRSTVDALASPPAEAAQPAARLVLDDLLRFPAARLEALYRAAPCPPLSALDGDLRGRMLAWPGAGRATGLALRSLAGRSWFPWRGKSFRPLSGDAGEGINRVISDARRWYRFETRLGPSLCDGREALLLDYDLPTNPFFIRPIKDEVRTLQPGLFLGQAWLAAGAAPRLVLYFALEG